MIDNYDISEQLGMLAKLAELHDENPFKVKAYSAAAFNIKKIKEPLAGMDEVSLSSVPGVGKSVMGAVKSLALTGSIPELEALVQKTPEGVLDMLRIKGLGPKKVRLIWKNMGLEAVEELFDACRENRLVEQPGFGHKTQGEIMRNIEFSLSAKGKQHYARLEKPCLEWIAEVKTKLEGSRIEPTGEFRRKCNIIEQLEWISDAGSDKFNAAMKELGWETISVEGNFGKWKNERDKEVSVHFCRKEEFERVWFETTGSAAHLRLIGYIGQEPFEGESTYYESKGYPFVEPEMREGLNELQWLDEFANENLLDYNHLKGIIHNHTQYSDGLHSLEEMANYAKELDFEYLVICDHSKSATYANGLNEQTLEEQWNEIDHLNTQLAPFKVFKGIECDILNDGSLDYSNEILAKFDLVVASVHSNLKMDKERATARIIKAIENPYTRILGHPTGRLLLVREGYELDHEKVIDACAANGVTIELNAHPYRLDLDWKWIYKAMQKGVWISVNPDAHEKEGYHDMYFGTLSARKGGLTKQRTLNALDLPSFEKWLQSGKMRAL